MTTDRWTFVPVPHLIQKKKAELTHPTHSPIHHLHHQETPLTAFAMETKRVLVVGGTGYLGQHVLLSLSRIKDSAPYDLAFTYHSNSNLLEPLLDAIPHSHAFHVDLTTGDGFQSIASKFGQVQTPPRKILLLQFSCSLFVNFKDLLSFFWNVCQPHVVVNCAALSVPRVCEKDPDAAMSINVPCSLVNWLSSFEERDTLLIHLSTDQG